LEQTNRRATSERTERASLLPRTQDQRTSFYRWRKRLRQEHSAELALLEPKPAGDGVEAALELLLSSGERLLIRRGVDAETLRTVLDAVRT
jgi:hypothetical protein